MLLAALQQVSTAGGGRGAGPGCGSLFPLRAAVPGESRREERRGAGEAVVRCRPPARGWGESRCGGMRVCVQGGQGGSGPSLVGGRGDLSLVSSLGGEKVAERTRCGETGAVRRKAEPRVPPGQVGLQPGRPR